jgi:dCMP deaminase
MCRGTHAEQNAIIQAAIHGVSTDGATLYCTHQPCILCAKMLINAGVRQVIFQGDYPDELALELMNEAKMKMAIWSNGEE